MSTNKWCEHDEPALRELLAERCECGAVLVDGVEFLPALQGDLGTVLNAADAYAEAQEEEASQGGWGPSRTEELREDAESVRAAVKRLEGKRT